MDDTISTEDVKMNQNIQLFSKLFSPCEKMTNGSYSTEHEMPQKIVFILPMITKRQ